MKTYTINFVSGRKVQLHGEPVEPASDSDVVSIRNEVQTYNIVKANVLYWSISEEDWPSKSTEKTVDVLTDRQKKVLEGMAEGKPNRVIARELGFSESTIRLDSLQIYRTLGVSGRKEAVKTAGLDASIDI